MSRWQFRQFAPPKARGKLKNVDPDNWIVETKYDGDRRIAQFCFEAVRFTGTRQSVDGTGFVEKTDNLPHLNKRVLYLEGTVLDGEIVCLEQGARSKDVASIMGSAPEVAIAKQRERGWLAYMVFDCLFYRGTDIRQRPLEARREMVFQVVREWKREVLGGQFTGEYVRVISQLPASQGDLFFKAVVQGGGEGVVYKDLRSRYGDQKAWVKRKRKATYDVIVTGYEPGRGKYLGQVGALKFAQYKNGELLYCGKCSGMTDVLRATISKEPERYMNTVIEIKANARENSGKFRHPQFVRQRPDKNPNDCVFNKEEQ